MSITNENNSVNENNCTRTENEWEILENYDESYSNNTAYMQHANNNSNTMSYAQGSTSKNIKIWTEKIKKIVINYNSRIKTLIFMRGAPGSGKSHLARQIVEITVGPNASAYNLHIFSIHDFFMSSGVYKFDKARLSDAHLWNQKRARRAITEGISPVIIDNTNIEIWEMKPYAVDAVNNGYAVDIIEPDTPWAKRISELKTRNIHNVPEKNIQSMLDTLLSTPLTVSSLLRELFDPPDQPGSFNQNETVHSSHFVNNTQTETIKEIVKRYNEGIKVLIFMRGAPGSGKSHLARQIVEITVGPHASAYNLHIFSTNDFFMSRGVYKFDKAKMLDAHVWNQKRARLAIIEGISPIIIDNTNIESWEMKPYAVDAVDNGYTVEIIEPDTPWAKKFSQLKTKNTHNVPERNIQRMLDILLSTPMTGSSLLEELFYPPDPPDSFNRNETVESNQVIINQIETLNINNNDYDF